MLTFFIYIVFGMFASWVFKIVAGLIETVSMASFGLFSDNLERNIVKHPKKFFTVLIIKNAIIGSVNAYMILYVTAYILMNYDANYWLYVITSIIWSLSIMSYNGITPFVTLFTSTGNLVAIYLSFSYNSFIIFGVIAIVVSISYHFGRINTYKSQFQEIQDDREIIDITP
jgi:hypothetical protein